MVQRPRTHNQQARSEGAAGFVIAFVFLVFTHEGGQLLRLHCFRPLCVTSLPEMSRPDKKQFGALADTLNDRSDLVGVVNELFGPQFSTESKRVIHHALLCHAKLRNAKHADLNERERPNCAAPNGV